MKNYIYPIIIVILLMIFYLGIPDLGKVEIGVKRGKIGRNDRIIMAANTAVFAVVDFVGLGINDNPQTFAKLLDETAYMSLDGNTEISKIVLYTGVGTGDYIIDYSCDGSNWTQAYYYTQDSAAVLKWQTIVPQCSITKPMYIRMYSSGNAYMGEVAFIDPDGNIIPYSCSVGALNDEQNTIQFTQTYLNSTYFDEIYHARTAWEHLNNIYPYEISHPPLGKLIIGIGILIFGMTPFGWRFSGTLFGVLMIPLLYIFAKKIFDSTRVATCTALLLATEFMHFVQTRISTIDTYAVFFTLLMYLFMYLYITEEKQRYLALCGIFFGFGTACKWTCLYAGAGLAVIWLIYRISKRKEGISSLVKNIGFCLIFFIFIPAVIYSLSYIPYATASSITPVFSKQFYKMIIDNQKMMFTYHSTLVAEHPYSSKWYQWIFDIRPILYYLKYNSDGTRQSFGSFMNPITCWGGLVAMFVLLYYTVAKREKASALILLGYLSCLVPWIFVKRITFAYHYFSCSVFLVLAIGYVFATMEKGGKHSKIYIYAFTAVSAVLFIGFYPVLSGIPISENIQHTFLSWLPTWPF